MTRLSPESFFDSRTKTRLRRKLNHWFATNQRDLPWRNNRTLYRVWVSEIMLQQTQVATVVDYYRHFLRVFPSIRKLAAADEQQVLKLWEGLGYYRRARQMHKAARVIVESHGGRFPKNFDDVLALPGIGRYTAGAILSIADEQRLPILEGNTERLFCRLLMHDSDSKSTHSQKRLWDFSSSLLPRKNVGDFNQALMELGALVCTPSSPDCTQCPISDCCLAHIQNVVAEYPAKKAKVKYESVVEAVVILKHRKDVLLRKGREGERWGGMWDFPRYRMSEGFDLQKRLKFDLGCRFSNLDPFCDFQHSVTRFRIQLKCFTTSVTAKRRPSIRGFQWFSIDKLPELALNVTARKIANRIAETN